MQEWFGYVLSGRTDVEKILLMIGPARSGKGTIARILAAMVGRGHVAGPTLASLQTNFGLSPLLGKPLAIVSDARLGSNTNVPAVVERLLAISGEDMLTIDRKYRGVQALRIFGAEMNAMLPALVVGCAVAGFIQVAVSRDLLLTLGQNLCGLCSP